MVEISKAIFFRDGTHKGFYQGLLFPDISKDGDVGESMQRGPGGLGGRMEPRDSREEGRAEGSIHFMGLSERGYSEVLRQKFLDGEGTS